ncbi:MAG TPA: chemotaxis protein CheW [Polyangiaceae bacterium]|jgi:purine-binding chemotaxis protein CheW|nr:chemotaxis protein CheW [Polyangiaceae bacterium]
MSETTQFCTFVVDDLLFGVDVTRVQEVIRFQEMTNVPLAPRMVRGLINLRGQIVMAVDLRERLCLPARQSDELPMNVVIRGLDGSVSLLVDSIGDVIEVSGTSFEAPPSTMLAAHRQVVDAVCKLPNRLLLVLDPERALSLGSEPASAQVGALQ